MKKKGKLMTGVSLLLVSCMLAGSTVSAASYKNFPYLFVCDPKAPTSTYHIKQTVEVYGGQKANAYAKCTQYLSTGNNAVLTVKSVTDSFPTTSVSFTGTSNGKAMKYKNAIPLAKQKIKFRGTVTKYTAFTIKAQVKG